MPACVCTNMQLYTETVVLITCSTPQRLLSGRWWVVQGPHSEQQVQYCDTQSGISSYLLFCVCLLVTDFLQIPSSPSYREGLSVCENWY